MYVCTSCGGDLVFNPKKQKLQCEYCRKLYAPGSVDKLRLTKAGEVVHQIQNEDGYKAIAYKCSHCGAELITTNETISTFCSFCRTGTLIEREVIKKRKPDYIIPFKISKKECEEIYVKKIKNSLFAPKTMIETQEVEKIRGIYMPYWIYNFDKHGVSRTKGSRYSHRSGDYKYYDDFDLTTTIDAECEGIIHDATSNFSDRLSEAIAPFSMKEKKEFSPSYLSGFYADNEDVDEDLYLEDTHDIASKYISKELGKDKIYHKYGAHPNVILDKKSVDLALFPVYFLVTKNKTKNRVSYAVINGQTGKIAADIPIDIRKFALTALLLMIPIFFILNIAFTFTMPKLISMSIVFNILSIIILARQNKKIDNIENDKGQQYKGKDYNSEEYKKKIIEKIEKKEDRKIRRQKQAKLISIAVPFIFLLVFYTIMTIIISGRNIINFTKTTRYVIGGIILVITFLAMIIRKIRHPEKDTSFYKQIIGLLATLLVFCFKPADDTYYYATAIFSIGINILSFYNIVEKLNIIATRKLPQLEKRGGDENA